MAQPVVLNKNVHQQLRIQSSRNAVNIQAVSHTLTFPNEFMEIQKEYPILFSKNQESGAFQSVVVLGIEQGENLLFDGNQWQTKYVPAVLAKGPFLIGTEQQNNNGTVENVPVVCVDQHCPSVNNEEGELLFTEDGTNTDYLNYVNSLLLTINDGNQLSEKMFQLFTKYQLIEPISLNIELNNGQKIQLTGNYTINEPTLAQLNGEALAELSQAGVLKFAYMAIASLSNIQHLVNLKNNQNSD